MFQFAYFFENSLSAINYKTQIVLQAFFLTAAVVAALTIYTFQTKRDFSAWGGCIFAALWILILGGLLQVIPSGTDVCDFRFQPIITVLFTDVFPVTSSRDWLGSWRCLVILFHDCHRYLDDYASCVGGRIHTSVHRSISWHYQSFPAHATNPCCVQPRIGLQYRNCSLFYTDHCKLLSLNVGFCVPWWRKYSETIFFLSLCIISSFSWCFKWKIVTVSGQWNLQDVIRCSVCTNDIKLGNFTLLIYQMMFEIWCSYEYILFELRAYILRWFGISITCIVVTLLLNLVNHTVILYTCVFDKPIFHLIKCF